MKVPVIFPPELQNPFQAAAAGQSAPPRRDHGQLIAAAGTAISEANSRYRELRDLIRQINGMADSAPLPDTLHIESIVITYRANDVVQRATVSRVQRVGDLFNLLTREVDELVNTLRLEAQAAATAAEQVADACNRAQYAANARQSQVTP